MRRIKLWLGYFSTQHNLLVDLRNLQPNITYNDSSKNQPNLICWCQVVLGHWVFVQLSKFIFHNTIEPNILILSKLILRIPKYIKVTYMLDFYFSWYQIKVYMLMYVTVHTNTEKPSSIFVSTLVASDEDSHNINDFEHFHDRS